MIKREFGFFVVNGLISVSIAYCVYCGLVASGLMIEIANGIAYIAGMFYGFFANKRLAFRDGEIASIAKVVRYVLLHTCTLIVNILTNSLILGRLGDLTFDFFVAFLAAIAISTILNFIGLKYWVFKRNARSSVGTFSSRIVE